ncbi:MAG: DUF87 domain-containing protein, partial [Candidatus Micrarchaeota archaeon]
TIGGDIGTACPSCAISLSPSFRGLLSAGTNFTSNVSITIPPTQTPGSFYTFVQANASGLLDTVLINITIPSNGSWIRTPSSFGNLTLSPNSTGTVGNITVTNNGNIKSTFTFATSGAASPYLLFDGQSVFAVDIDKQIARNVSVTYSISSGTSAGFYAGTINILSSNGTPSSQTIIIGLNITDLPPQFQNISAFPQNIEQTYGNSSAAALVTDNFGVSSVWINITRNGSTISQPSSFFAGQYNSTFNSTISGLHQIIVCANDTIGQVNCSSGINVTVHSLTNLSVYSPTITISNVSISSGSSTNANITFINAGFARTLNTTFNLTLPQNITASPNNSIIGTIFASSNGSVQINFSASAGTQFGTYLANLTLNWTNLNGSSGSNTTQIAIIVASNTIIDINETSLSSTVTAGSSSGTSMTLVAAGSSTLTGISYSCITGTVCSSFTVSFNPSSVSSISAGSSSIINITTNVPAGFASGVYTGTIIANATNASGDAVILTVTVPSNLSWTQSPSTITAEVIQGTSGQLGIATATNIGNQILFLTIASQGNISSVISYNASSLLLSSLSAGSFQINYTAPAVSVLTNYIGNASTQNATATPSQQVTAINLTVHPFYVIINSPTQSAPVLGINAGQNITAIVNATYGSNALSANVSFNVTIQDSTTKTPVAITTQIFGAGLWYLNFTAPSLTTGRSYDLNVTGFDLIRRINLTKIESRAIGYNDTTPPSIVLIANSSVVRNSPNLLRINLTDSGTIFQNSTAILANITYPGGAVQIIQFNFSSVSGDSYLFSNNFANTSIAGNHTIRARGCDASNNCNYTSGVFEVKSAIQFMGNANDTDSISFSPLSVRFRLSSTNNYSDVVHDFTSNSSGEYNETVYNQTYFVNATFAARGLFLTEVPITTDYKNPIIFGIIPTSRIGTGSLLGMTYRINLTHTDSNISFNYAGQPYSLETNLGIYSCSSYLQFTGCLANWTRITSTRDSSRSTISANVANASLSFALAEYICGNGICESSTGESNAVCSLDCIGLNATPTPTAVPSTGGGAGTGTGGSGAGAGGGAGAGTGTPTAFATIGGGGIIVNGSGGGNGDRIGPPEVRSNAIDLTMKPGDKRTQIIDLINNVDNDLLASFLIEGDAAAFLTIERPTLTIKARTSESIRLAIAVPDTTFPGVYTADIIVKLGNVVKITPVTLRIEKSRNPLLDVKVTVLSKVLRPGDTMRSEVTLINRGEAETATDVSLQYALKTLNDDKTIYSSSETVQISDLLVRNPTAPIPANTEAGIYIFQVTATYMEGRKVSQGSDSVEVTGTSVTGLVVQTITSSWLTYLLIIGIMLFIGGRRAYAIYQQRKLRGQRYVVPLDFKKLPQAGPRAIPVGRVAETDVSAYFDMDKLQTHSIAAGGTGSGKSVSAQVVAEELLKRNVPVIVFDPTAQWTGYIRPNKDKQMLALYPKFGMKPEDVKGYKTNVIPVIDPGFIIDLKKYLIPGEMTVFVMNKLPPADLDRFVKHSIQAVFDSRPLESKELKLLIIYDEIHRLLPKYGGKGAYAQLERGYREFRKWGIGMFMISQVLLDFKGAVRANIANEIQLRTKYEGDIGRVKTKYGNEYASKVTKLTIGTGLVQNPEYNDGKPWFIAF